MYTSVGAAEDDMRQLSHALKILSQTEKQLRVSNNQMTWLTVALLQLSSTDSSHEGSDPRLSTRSLLAQGEVNFGNASLLIYVVYIETKTTMAHFHSTDGDFLSSSSTGESFKRSVACACVDAESEKTGLKYDKETLDLVWIRAAATCSSSSLKKFLLKRGNLVSVCLTQGIYNPSLVFCHIFTHCFTFLHIVKILLLCSRDSSG